MTHVDFLIIGQGISGSFLCHELEKQGFTFIVMDDNRKNTASHIASGIINPVTGRRIVKTWIIDELMPFALEAYTNLGNLLKTELITTTTDIDFFPTPQMRLAFLDRVNEDSQYLSLPSNENDWQEFLQYSFGYGVISPCYLVNLQGLLPAFRKMLVGKNILSEERFDQRRLVVNENDIQYEDITATKIIFCDGIDGHQLPWFRNLPFAPNKGEVLIIRVSDLPAVNILKKGISIVPWMQDLFWVGSSHEWKFDDDQPTAAFRQKTEAQLKSFLRLPFTVEDHWAAVRPATLERRPFVGLHPQYPQIGIFNGMGTKGCSLAPYFAHQFTRQLAEQSTLSPEVNIDRFTKLLARNT